MGEPKGYKLFVNLGASQTRRRLKSFGHGVRKIQTDGKDRAVVIHTATGRHLAELVSKFADVGSSTVSGELDRPLECPSPIEAQAAAPEDRDRLPDEP